MDLQQLMHIYTQISAWLLLMLIPQILSTLYSNIFPDIYLEQKLSIRSLWWILRAKDAPVRYSTACDFEFKCGLDKGSI